MFLLGHSDNAGLLGRLDRRLTRMLFGPVRKAFGGRVEFLVSGSAPMPVWLLRSFDAMGLPVLEAYGLSENIVPISVNRVADFRHGSVGKPLEPNELVVAEDGELLCRGPGVCRRYLGDEQAVQIDGEGLLATGDYAEIDSDGFVWLKGRKSDIFKTNTGRRISPVEIEDHVRQSGMVDHAVAVGAGRKFVVVLVTVAGWDEARPEVDQLEQLRQSVSRSVGGLPKHKRPVGMLVMRRAFSPLTGELTANLKLKRKVIETKLEAEIDALYRALDSVGWKGSAMISYNATTHLVRL